MNQILTTNSHIKGKTLKPLSLTPLSISDLSAFEKNNNKKRPLETNSQNLSFKGLSSYKVNDLLTSFEKEFGEVAKSNFSSTIDSLANSKFVAIEGAKNDRVIKIRDESLWDRINDSIISPLIHLPVDFLSAILEGAKKLPLLKNSSTLENMLNSKMLKNRRDSIAKYSNTKAVQHYAEMLKDSKKSGKIFNEGMKRLNPGLANYSTKVERTVTRIVTGIIPGFFLANDAYNLSIYLNDNKDLASKAKKRRFHQEITRIGITAASTFAVLGLFAKKSNSNPKTAMYLMAGTTLASEIIGRMVTGMPFYPISSKGAEKYAKRKNEKVDESKNKSMLTGKQTNINQPQKFSSDKENNKSKSSDALKLLGALVLIGFAADHYSKIKPLNRFVSNIKDKYNAHFCEDFVISKAKFAELKTELEKNGFIEIADRYQKMVDEILSKGNLNIEESARVAKAIDEKAEKQIGKTIVFDVKGYEQKKKAIIEGINRQEIMAELKISSRANDDILYIHSLEKKRKDIIINQILGFPVKLIKEIVLMPYNYVVKPLYELPKSGIKILLNKSEPIVEKSAKNGEILKNSISFLRELRGHSKEVYQKRLNDRIVESFDNVTKSNFSNAELSGTAKTAVSTVTSAFLIFDNYNMVMMDSAGKDKEMAGQKAKERTIQRIVRIAYGACLIKLFNGIFSKYYDRSLLGAQGVNILSTGVVETLERTSVGLPLYAATREEIMEKDDKNLNASGIRGKYYRYMAKLTGKKSLAEMKAEQK